MGGWKVIHCLVLMKGNLLQINQHEAFGGGEHFGFGVKKKSPGIGPSNEPVLQVMEM